MTKDIFGATPHLAVNRSIYFHQMTEGNQYLQGWSIPGLFKLFQELNNLFTAVLNDNNNRQPQQIKLLEQFELLKPFGPKLKLLFFLSA